MALKPVHVLINDKAGNGKARREYEAVLGELHRQAADPTPLFAKTRDEAFEQCQQAVREGVERLIVIGGDGTVHLAVNAVAGTPTTLGVVSSGSGNDLGRALGLPSTKDLDRCVRAALSDPSSIDVIQTSAGKIATIGILGFPADVNARVEALDLPKALHSTRYVVGTVAGVRNLHSIPMKLVFDDGFVIDEPLAIVAIANTSYFGNGLKICPDADPTDGLLDVCVVRETSRAELLRVLPMVFFGKHVNNKKVEIIRAKSVAVQNTETEIRGDGEHVGYAPSTFGIEPLSLHIAGVSDIKPVLPGHLG